MQSEPIVVEKTYAVNAARVWRAITDKDEMKNWYFKLDDFRAESGFEFSFTGGREGGIQYVHRCKITEVIPGKKLVHTWTYDGYPGVSYVTWELFPQGEQTLLRLTHTGLETLPAEPDFARENFLQGWSHILPVSLANYLAGES